MAKRRPTNSESIPANGKLTNAAVRPASLVSVSDQGVRPIVAVPADFPTDVNCMESPLTMRWTIDTLKRLIRMDKNKLGWASTIGAAADLVVHATRLSIGAETSGLQQKRHNKVQVDLADANTVLLRAVRHLGRYKEPARRSAEFQAARDEVQALYHELSMIVLDHVGPVHTATPCEPARTVVRPAAIDTRLKGPSC